MITTSKIPFMGRIAAIAIYTDGSAPTILQRFAADDFQAENILKKFKKDILRKKFSHFLNHRKNIMDYHGGLRTQTRLEKWEQLKRNFDFMYDKSLESNCKLILTSKDDILLLMPGELSKFFETTKKNLDEIFEFCNTQTK